MPELKIGAKNQCDEKHLCSKWVIFDIIRMIHESFAFASHQKRLIQLENVTFCLFDIFEILLSIAKN